jgi:hypothetical protein
MGDRTSTTNRLERAKAYLAIAEAGDARHEAYRQAAEEIAAYRDETGATWPDIAMSLGQHLRRVQRLMEWRRGGYTAASPWLADEQATTRAADSHARKVVRERPEVIADEMAKVGAERRAEFAARLLADDATADALVGQHPEAAGAVYGAIDRRHATRPAAQPAPLDRLDLLADVLAVRRKLASLLARVREAGPLGIPADVQTSLRAHAEWVRNAMDLIVEAAEGGDWDRALADLMADEGVS